MTQQHSYFKTINSPYYIFTVENTQKSAGIRVLHTLCHALNELGAQAYLVGCSEDSSTLRTPLLTKADVLKHRELNLTPIMVYPEVVSGNPLNMPHVARWLLNRPGHVGGDVTFEPSELLFAYTEDYVPEGLSLYTLYIPAVNNEIFNNLNNPYDRKRQGSCYYAHKYLAQGGELTEHANGATSLCQDVDLSPQQIADVLRRSEFLYCYEPSAIITEARLCGCTVIMVETPFLEENNQESIIGPGIATTSSCASDIETAKSSIHKISEEHDFHTHWSWQHVRTFIEHTQEVFAAREVEPSTFFNWSERIFKLIAQTSKTEVYVNTSFNKEMDEKKWLEQTALSEGQATIMAEKMHHAWLHHPTFHLIIVLNPDEIMQLPETLDSLQQQLYSAWGLSIISPMEQPEFLTDLPENIEWISLTKSLNETINETVSETGLDWVFQLLPGDTLFPQALWSFADTINRNVDFHMIYSDEVSTEKSQSLLFKPDFNLELLRSSSYLGRSAIISRDSFEKIGGYTGLAYVHITDLAFHVYEQWGGSAVGHIDDVLYRSAEVTCDQEILSENELAVRVAHIERLNIDAYVQLSENGFKINYALGDAPLVSIVIANKNNADSISACLTSIGVNTTYGNYEVLLIDQMSDIEDIPYIYKEAQDLLPNKLRIIEFAEANYSAAINFGVSQAKGQYIAVLSSLTMPVNESWLTELTSIVQNDDVGIVGGKAVKEREPYQILHAGGVLGIANDVTGLFAEHDFDDDGYMDRASLTQEYSFVSSAGFLVKKAHFIAVNGLDEVKLANSHYAITDFCLKIKQQGYRNIWTPQAVFRVNDTAAIHNNGVSEFQAEGVDECIIQRWADHVQHDAAFNRNLSLMEPDFSPQVKLNLGWQESPYKRPRIMAFPYSHGAIGEFRVRGPLNQLSRSGRVELSYLPVHSGLLKPYIPSFFEVKRANPDIVYLCYALSDEHYELIKWMKNETGSFIIFSIDDLIMILPKQNEARKHLYKDIRHRLRRTLALCDRLIVSTHPLADAFADYCDDIVVVPNSIDLERWSQVKLPTQTERKKLRVGWAGGQLHQGDLDVIVEVVKQTSQQVDWIFMGMCPEDLQPYLHEYHEFASFDEYPEKMANLDLDLAIAPLEVHPFNKAKSNLRLLEYGMLAWPVICTDIEPYQTDNPPVVRVDNTKAAWLAAIETAIEQPHLLKSKGLALQQWVKNNYVLDMYDESWLAALTKR